MIKNPFGSMKVILLTYAVMVLVGFALTGNAGAISADEAKAAGPGGHAALISKAEQKGTVRIIVGIDERFLPDAAAADAQSRRAAIAGAQDHILSELGMRGLGPAAFHKFKHIPYIAMSVNAETLQALTSSSRVVRIQEDIPARVNGAESWNMEKIGAAALHTANVTGTGMSVAVIDTGVDGSHPYLAGAVVSEACYSSNFTDSEGTYTSLCPGGATDLAAAGSAMPYSSGVCPAGECDHGTHVAGIVAGRDNVPGSPGPGVAPGAGIIAIQVFTLFDSEVYCAPDAPPCVRSWMTDRLKGLERVYELRNMYAIAAVNLSLSDLDYPSQKACEADNQPTKAAVDNLKRAGIATVASSGVTGHCGSLGAPSCISSAISVGATDSNDLVISDSNSASFLTLLAPGSGITSSVPGTGYDAWSGTSMSAPHVAGAWALAKQRRPTATVADILKTFTSTGQGVTDSKCTKVTKKRINVYQAYNYPPPTISVSPAALNFGSVKMGEASAVKTLTIKNTGPAGCSYLDISSITATPSEFTFLPASCPPLAKGESCVLSVRVTPASTYGSRTGSLVIASDASNKPSFSVKLSGNAASARISVPSALSFPAVASHGSAVKSIAIKNTGVSDLVIGVISKTGNQFAVSPACNNARIVKGGSCTIDVTFTPDEKTKYMGSITIPSTDQGKPSAIVTLKGSGK